MNGIVVNSLWIIVLTLPVVRPFAVVLNAD